MKSHLKIFFAALFIAQALFTLNLKAEESHPFGLNQILACKHCKKDDQSNTHKEIYNEFYS